MKDNNRLSEIINLWLIGFLVLLVLSSVSFKANAGLMNIVIDGGKLEGIPIAVVPFQMDGGGIQEGDDIAKVIQNDLQNSGQFQVIPSHNITQFPGSKD